MNVRKEFSTYTLALLLLGLAATTCSGQKLKDADCLACHSDATLTKDVNGKPVSLFVDGG